MNKIRFKIREFLRTRKFITPIVYTLQNYYYSYQGRLIPLSSKSNCDNRSVAICLRFRNEAQYLQEWIEYYLVAGVKHFYLYNNNSTDNYMCVLQKYVDSKVVTLIDWPYCPASPSAEEDCICRSIGQYAWVGFLDADEFIVIKNNDSIPDFLQNYRKYPAIALHWICYGSSYLIKKPNNLVIKSYKLRAKNPDWHVKVFVNPQKVTQCRNSHSWFYRNAQCAVNENNIPVRGSLQRNATSQKAWINHYYCKSLEDYERKMKTKSTLDWYGINCPRRTLAKLQTEWTENNDIEDKCAINYIEGRITNEYK
jgi:hypothetical protein